MVAQISAETFNRASQIPRPDPSDSDDLLLALETARALEAQGELSEAARWLRRAVEQAEMEGNDERVLVLARAAADLTTVIGSGSPPARVSSASPPPVPMSVPPSNTAERSSVRLPAPKPAAWAQPSRPPPAPRTPEPPHSSQPASTPQTPSAKAAHVAATSPRIAAPTAPRVSSASRVPARPPSPSVPVRVSAPPSVSARAAGEAVRVESDKPLPQPTLRVGTVRVAIPASGRDANVFVVRRLTAGQPLPPGTKEAMLVLPDDHEST